MAAIAGNYGLQLRLDLVDRMPRGAFGYSPERWPTVTMFGAAVTALQVKMVGVKGEERGVPRESLPLLRNLVLRAYGVGDGNSKANASLFIDWLMNADDESLDEALQAVESYDNWAQWDNASDARMTG